MERSRKLVLTDWTKADDALHRYFGGNKSKLTADVKMSRTTVTAFFQQKPMREAEFRQLCFALRLNWQEVAQVQANTPKTEQRTDSFQQVREHCRQKILNQHSRMRLLSTEEIGVDQLYVDVWLLNRSPRTFQVSHDKLLQTFDFRNDRLGLGDRIKRNPGFDIANANTKLLILGKPGAGKTTFLKHLAVDWCKGQFQPGLTAVFIEFRRIRDQSWTLADALSKELGLETWEQTEELLKRGKLLVLLDGLDEVPRNELRRKVQVQLREMTENYPHNRFILTCRTQVITSIPDGFTSVEVADFSSEQVQQFVQNWFRASGRSETEAAEQWERFHHTVGKNPALQELTVTPVLLSLMCVVFQDEGDMPSQMTDLYKRGIRLLLEKWNDAKAIEGWEVGSDTYRQLSVGQKEALLIEIAARKFENPENFVLFEQADLVNYIDEFLRRANFSKKIARLLRRNAPGESIMVLKMMETQHGLLIERADRLWSFSHLTFQEYFTAQWLTELPPAQLAEKIANSQWQKVVEQLVKSQQPADRLLRLIKQSIDRSIAGEPTLNQFLTWVFEKAGSVQANYKPAALQAFYFALALNLALDLALARAPTLAIALDPALDRAFARDFDHALDCPLDFDLALTHALALTRALNLARAHAVARALARARALVRDLACDFELIVKLEQLETQLPSLENWPHFQHWWQTQGRQWLEDLRQVMIQHRNIGHDWRFQQQQKQQLQNYYDANRFLIKLMKIKGAVSGNVRAEIEDNLLLPWDELQRRYPEIYGNS